MRKVYVEFKCKAVLIMDEGVSLSEVMGSLDPRLETNRTDLNVEDVEILPGYNIVDSK